MITWYIYSYSTLYLLPVEVGRVIAPVDSKEDDVLDKWNQGDCLRTTFNRDKFKAFDHALVVG